MNQMEPPADHPDEDADSPWEVTSIIEEATPPERLPPPPGEPLGSGLDPAAGGEPAVWPGETAEDASLEPRTLPADPVEPGATAAEAAPPGPREEGWPEPPEEPPVRARAAKRSRSSPRMRMWPPLDTKGSDDAEVGHEGKHRAWIARG